jgi:putative hydrolase of the HAD superfamily
MDAILFDLDNTLYAPERDLFSLIDKRINRFMEEVVAIRPAEVDGLRRHYWKAYGATLQGLIRHYGVDPEHYLEYVHDVDVAGRLLPDLDLGRELSGLAARRCIFTNGSRGHAERVLAALGLAEHFEEIFDIRVAAYQPKPCPDPYYGVLAALGLGAERCIMVEDSLDNLATAKDLGMTTVLVGAGPPAPFVDYQAPTAFAACRLVGSLF